MGISVEEFKELEKIKKQEDFENWIKAKVSLILKEMMVPFVHIKYCFNYSKCDQIETKDGYATFRIEYSVPYHQTTLYVYPVALKMYEDGKKDELIDGLIHEMTHIHTVPVDEAANSRYATEKELRDLCEDLTETMAQYIRKLIKLNNNNEIYEKVNLERTKI